ncbi:MAG TPA: hybrid sensor histidine kinase/response regulator [Humisphaera sp.]
MNARAVRVCRIVAPVAGALAAAVGCVGLLGWVLDAERLKTVVVGGLGMKANTAACLVLCGLGLALRAAPSAGSTVRRRLGLAAGAVAAAVGGLTFAEHLTGWDLGIDQLLFREPPGAPGTTSPGRMGPPASLSFLLAGTALTLLDARTRRGSVPAQGLGLGVGLIALVPLIGYSYSIEPLYGLSRFTAISVNTAAATAALALGLLVARPTEGLMAVVVADDAGGLMARRMLVPAVAVPFVLGWLRTVGQRAGLIDEALGRPVLVLSLIASFTALVWWNARSLSVLGRQRARAEAEREDLLVRERAARARAEEMAAEAARAGRMKDEFLATLSHELRTPLNAIVGWSQILARGPRTDADLDRGLATIDRNARAQARIIEDLLDMSGIVSGKVRLDVRPVDLSAVVRAALDTVAPVAAAKGVRVEAALDPGGGWVAGDPDRLRQVFWNLLTNAVKFTPRDGRVRASLARADGRLVATVSDTGEGISAEFLPHVFDRFRQQDASTTRRHGGLGLGLSIVRQLVELHGGRVRAASDGPGLGSTFTVELPAAPAVPPPSPGPDAAAPDAAIAGLRVLVVDDEPDGRAVVRRLLEAYGAVVTTAGSAAEAIERFDRPGPPDVLVSDVGMPGDDGYALVRRLRARAASRGGTVPAVALTAYASPADRERALAAGFQTHLAKPVEPGELVATVAAVAGRSARPA